jgi:hypothetical protein
MRDVARPAATPYDLHGSLDGPAWSGRLAALYTS